MSFPLQTPWTAMETLPQSLAPHILPVPSLLPHSVISNWDISLSGLGPTPQANLQDFGLDSAQGWVLGVIWI